MQRTRISTSPSGLSLSIAAAASTSLLAGMALDQSIKQLPARKTLGARAFSAYSRAADLGNGIPLYAGFGIGSASLAISAAVLARVQREGPPLTTALSLSAFLAALHSVVTVRAASLNFSQRRYDAADEAALAHVQDRFATWHNVRTVIQLLNAGAAFWGMAVALRGRPARFPAAL
jgi:hypothetical protein